MLEDGMDEAELSWVLEDNVPMVKPIVDLIVASYHRRNA